jgi:hypothetical protein
MDSSCRERVLPVHSVADPVLFDSWMGKKSGSGSGMNNPDHISESLETIFLARILKFFDADPGSGMKKFGSGMKKFGSGMKKFGSGMKKI